MIHSSKTEKNIFLLQDVKDSLEGRKKKTFLYLSKDMATIRLYYGRDSHEMISRLREAKNGDFEILALEVRETVLDDCVIEAIVDLLLHREIKTVQLDDCGAYMNKPAISMARALGKVKNVRLAETFLSQFFLDSLLMSATKLEHLRVQDHLDCRQIEALALGLQKNSSVITLDLSRSRLDSFSILAKGLKSNSFLKTLKLRFLGLRDQDVNDILESIKDHPTLQVLDLSFNQCQNLQSMAKFLDANSTVEELLLGYQNVWQGPKIDIFELTRALCTNMSLTTLSLARNKLCDEDALLLANALLKNSCLQSLDVRENGISDFGITRLGTSLLHASEQGSKLKNLNLMKNPFGKTGMNALLSAVRGNMQLMKLELGNNNDWKLSQEIRYFTALNRGGRKLLYENPPLALWPLVLARVNNMDWDKESQCVASLQRNRSYQQDVLCFLMKGPALFEGLVCRSLSSF